MKINTDILGNTILFTVGIALSYIFFRDVDKDTKKRNLKGVR